MQIVNALGKGRSQAGVAQDPWVGQAMLHREAGLRVEGRWATASTGHTANAALRSKWT